MERNGEDAERRWEVFKQRLGQARVGQVHNPILYVPPRRTLPVYGAIDKFEGHWRQICRACARNTDSDIFLMVRKCPMCKGYFFLKVSNSFLTYLCTCLSTILPFYLCIIMPIGRKVHEHIWIYFRTVGEVPIPEQYCWHHISAYQTILS